MDAGERELLSYALVALAAGGAQVGMIDGRAGIARGQDVVDAVAARTIGSDKGTALGREPVIAVHVGRNAIAGKPEFLREAHAFMAARTGVLRQVLFRNR